MTTLLLFLVACTPDPLPSETDRIALRAVLGDEVTADGGTLSVQMEYEPDCILDVAAPEVAGLTFVSAPDTVPPERIGSRVAHTLVYNFTGLQGSYEIPAMIGSWTCGEERGQVQTQPIFVDLGVAPPRSGELIDIDDPWPVWTNLVPFRLLGFLLLSGGALIGCILMAIRMGRRPYLEPVPEEPPGAVALRRWEAVRSDPDLSEHDKAQHLARIFREYAESVLSFPATSWTTSEILTHLGQLPLLPKGNGPRAKRLLRATDLVKFAEHDPSGDFFDELDADLRAFIDSTQPHAWDAS